MVLVREGIACLCAASGLYEVVAQCSNGEQALALMEKLKPDLALLDYGLSHLFVLEVIRKARRAGIPTKSVVMAARADRKTVIEALRSGASGFVFKTSLVRELLDALQQAAAGAVWVPSQVGLERVWKVGRSKATDDPLDGLSRREHQVFSLLIDGHRTKEIAGRLGLSPKTVDTYRSNLMRKLDIHDVAGLVKFAIQRKLTGV